MNCFKTFMLALLYYNIRIEKINCYDSHNDLVTKLNSFISKNGNQWKYIIDQSIILVDGNLIKIQNYLEAQLVNTNVEYSNNQPIIANGSNVINISNMIYLALECEYSILINYWLQFLLQCISFCQEIKSNHEKPANVKSKEYYVECIKSAIKNFIELKPYTVKLIYNLLNFRTYFQILNLVIKYCR